MVADLQDLGKMSWQDGVEAIENSNSQGYDDWYLPNQEELILIYNTIGYGADNLGGFEDSWYWAGNLTGNPTNMKAVTNVSSNYWTHNPQTYERWIRAVRAF